MEAKKILVTGASRGIGLEVCRQMAEAGHQVLGISRGSKPTGLSERVHWLSGELSTEEFMQEVSHYWDGVDVVIHNAATLLSKPFEEFSLAEVEHIYKINVLVPYRLTQLLLPHLSKSAHVVFISSVGGINGSVKFPGLSAYSSSKAALACLAECLQEEYKESEMSFNALALGSAQTEMLAQAFPGFKARTSATDMAGFIVRFALNEGGLIKGKSLVVSSGNP